MMDSFEIDLVPPSWPVNIWLTAMIRLFKPQIIQLIEQCVEAIEQCQNDHLGKDVFEDRGLEINSEMAISVEDQFIAINKLL